MKSPPASSNAARKVMQANRASDTRPELALRRELHRRGLRYRKNTRPLPTLRRTADVVFPRERLAVFVDGCFWHGCPDHCRRPATNSEFWNAKLDRNRERDAETDRALLAAGWTVIRRFEHIPLMQFADDVEVALRRLRAAAA